MTSPAAPAVERSIPPGLVTRLGNPVLGWVLSGPAAVAAVYARLLDEVGLATAGRRLGIRVTVDCAPTRDELVDAVRREHLSVVRLRTDGTR